jgi:predicted DNA repair protein MutK
MDREAHMAGGSLLLLLDDIATVLDDVAVLSKVAAKKTAGVLGDDLALNAQQVTGVSAARELPVVFAVARGSLFNKLIIVPLALIASAYFSWLILPVLMLGGLYLCFEGAEKLFHPWFFPKETKDETRQLHTAASNPNIDLVKFERTKIKGAIRTDFILSLEIVVITLGTVMDKPLLTQTFVVSAIALVMTVGVYSLVALIVKLDDIGLHYMQQGAGLQATLGEWLVNFAPKLLKVLSFVGTAAMFLVGGGILVHGLPFFHHLVEDAALYSVDIPTLGTLLSSTTTMVLQGLFGVLAGFACVSVMALVERFRR